MLNFTETKLLQAAIANPSWNNCSERDEGVCNELAESGFLELRHREGAIWLEYRLALPSFAQFAIERAKAELEGIAK